MRERCWRRWRLQSRGRGPRGPTRRLRASARAASSRRAYYRGRSRCPECPRLRAPAARCCSPRRQNETGASTGAGCATSRRGSLDDRRGHEDGNRMRNDFEHGGRLRHEFSVSFDALRLAGADFETPSMQRSHAAGLVVFPPQQGDHRIEVAPTVLEADAVKVEKSVVDGAVVSGDEAAEILAISDCELGGPQRKFISAIHANQRTKAPHLDQKPHSVVEKREDAEALFLLACDLPAQRRAQSDARLVEVVHAVDPPNVDSNLMPRRDDVARAVEVARDLQRPREIVGRAERQQTERQAGANQSLEHCVERPIAAAGYDEIHVVLPGADGLGKRGSRRSRRTNDFEAAALDRIEHPRHIWRYPPCPVVEKHQRSA